MSGSQGALESRSRGVKGKTVFHAKRGSMALNIGTMYAFLKSICCKFKNIPFLIHGSKVDEIHRYSLKDLKGVRLPVNRSF
jgi:hypothetical protein